MRYQRHHPKLSSSVAIAVLLAAMCISFGDGLTPYRNEIHHFMLTPPPGWTQIPPDILEARITETARVTSTPAPVYVAGFQWGSAGWFSYPYVLIQVDSEGRIPEAEITRRIASGRLREITAGVLTKDLGTLMTGAQVGQQFYDASGHTIWTSALAQAPDRQNPKGPRIEYRMLNAMFLTGHGFVSISGYYLSRRENEELPLLLRLFTSFKGMPGHEYSK